MEKYYTIKLENGKEYDLRLGVSSMKKIEATYKTPLLNFIQSSYINNVLTLLKFMRKAKESSFSDDDAEKFFDELVDNGYKLETIIMDVILPTCEVSGLFTKEDLARVKVLKENRESQVEANNTNI